MTAQSVHSSGDADGTDLSLPGLDGLQLAATAYGSRNASPVVLMGGMGQTRHAWSRAARQIAASGRRAITLDYRGHGDSDWSDRGDYTLPTLGREIVMAVSSLGRPVVLVGASLGGKIALQAAGTGGPDLACALVMVDTAPRTEPAGVAAVTQILKPPKDGFESPDAAAAELARIRGVPVAPNAGARLIRNMRRDASGRWRWHWDPAYSSQDQGNGFPACVPLLEASAAQVRVPALLTRGELSPVVGDAGVEALRALIPRLEVEVIPGASHMIVGDQNDLFADALLRFLARTPGL